MTEILVEVSPVNVSGDLARRLPAAPEVFTSRAGEIADSIIEVADKLRDHLEENLNDEESHLWHLSTVQLGFELALKAGTGVVIAQASAETTFSATLTWSKEPVK